MINYNKSPREKMALKVLFFVVVNKVFHFEFLHTRIKYKIRILVS